ncbi:hypothetical protein [Burkholderia sp. Ax-1724]|uniref:hypothetical protein n=1 Tax=Burkholderia sp. Ax-1724 TaxID=2608336 RepID=UPI00141FEADA|nr:hypothetical protein [Burkholderia sp. Ax-1724]NIF54862.1 hypothetical protein [Burkholderia sp. Ax-1724]
MGMDVIGRSPVSSTGEYFRNNVWWWHPLWQYCERIAPDIIPRNNLGHSNDGWGLGHQASVALAARLDSAIRKGHTTAYARARETHLASLPAESCSICGGSGMRAEPPAIGPGTLTCNGCNGMGHRPNFETNYPFSVENVREFIAFLRDCGGFRIC